MLHCNPGVSNNAVNKVKVHGSQIKLVITLVDIFKYKRGVNVISLLTYLLHGAQFVLRN